MTTTIPLLLTSSVIAHDKGVKLQDTSTRLHHTLESIAQWLDIDPQLPIVICDGSGVNLTSEIQERFPTAQIECLHTENNQELVRQFGRGYGEGEIVKYALLHSSLIARHGCFAKCSSKLWVRNFSECKQFWNQEMLCKGVFLDVFSPHKRTQFIYIDTRFYIMNVGFYKKYFMTAHHAINTATGHGLEECFRDIVLKHHMKNKLMPTYPVIQGVGGGTGEYYKNSVKRLFKEKCRLYIAKKTPAFKDLFCHSPL